MTVLRVGAIGLLIWAMLACVSTPAPTLVLKSHVQRPSWIRAPGEGRVVVWKYGCNGLDATSLQKAFEEAKQEAMGLDEATAAQVKGETAQLRALYFEGWTLDGHPQHVRQLRYDVAFLVGLQETGRLQ